MVKVEVDYEKCTGCGTCIDTCPVEVFELRELPEYGGESKSVVVNNDECLACLACEAECPELAITVTE